MDEEKQTFIWFGVQAENAYFHVAATDEQEAELATKRRISQLPLGIDPGVDMTVLPLPDEERPFENVVPTFSRLDELGSVALLKGFEESLILPGKNYQYPV